MNSLEDFLEERLDVVVIDVTGDAQEADEPEKSVNEVSPKKDVFKENLDRTIMQYENLMLNGSFADKSEKSNAEVLLSSLKKQREEYVQKQSTSKPQAQVSLAERRINGLKEIFGFYSR